MTIQITGITIVHVQDSTDIIFLDTNLQKGVYPFEGTEKLRMDVAQGMGEEYCKIHFPNIEPKVIHD